MARQPWDQTGDAFTAVVQKWNFTVKQKPPFKIDMKTWMAWLKDPDYKERMTKKHTLIRGEPYTFDHVLPEKWKALCLYPAAKNFDAMTLTIKEEEGLEGCFKVDKRADGNWTFSVRDAFFVFGFGDC